MKLIIAYLLLLLTTASYLLGSIELGYIPVLEKYHTILYSILSGAVGGILYCLRAIYLNYSVKKNWDKDWHVWYYIRPIASAICGGASFIFLKAGLVILESQSKPDATDLAFFAFAFIAGLNVDKFVNKIEEFAKNTWGIEKSRSSNNE